METILARYEAIGWPALVIFVVGWFVVGGLAVWLLRKESIFGAFLAALFGVGAIIMVELQIPPDYEPSILTSLLPVLSGIFCTVVLFGSAGKGLVRKYMGNNDSEKEEQ